MLKRRRKEAEVIAISDDMDANFDSDLPGWLPDGWERVRRWSNNHGVSYYFPCPVCVGITLRTQNEVLRHCLFSCEDAPLKSQELFSSRQLRHTKKSKSLKDGQKSGSSGEGGQFDNSLFDSIPSGWIIEIRHGPRENAENYMLYVEPTKGYRFSSKEEVHFYLKEGKPLYAAYNEILNCDTKGEDNMIAELQFSPEKLPYGWIKETKYRRNYATSKSKKRKDVYYIDPESRLAFRSLNEVERYLQTGELAKQATVRRRSFADLYLFKRSSEMPEHAVEIFSPSSKRIKDCDDEVHKNTEEYLMGPTDVVLQTSEAFVKGGTEHECPANVGTEVGTRTELLEPNGSTVLSTVDQEQWKEKDFSGVQKCC